MKCPVIDYHKNRSYKWWIKYVVLWIVALPCCGIIQWDDIDRWVNNKKGDKN